MYKRAINISLPVIAGLFIIISCVHVEGSTDEAPQAPSSSVSDEPMFVVEVPKPPVPAPEPQIALPLSPDVLPPAVEPQPPVVESPLVEVQPAPPATEGAQPIAPPPAAPDTPKVFEGKGLGYKIVYPSDWVYEAPTQYQIIFSGMQGTPAYYSTVSVQNVASTALGGKHDSIESVKNSLFQQLRDSDSEVRIYDEKPYRHERVGKQPLAGVEFMAEYTNNKERFKQWVIIIERPGKEVYHIWSYTSPSAQYDEYLAVGADMLDSWVIQ